MTLGLTIITKEATEPVVRLINRYSPYFDAIYVQINGKGTRVPKIDNPKVEFSRHKWTDDFSAARNALLNHVKTDYWTWMDTDDIITGVAGLREVAQRMAEQNIDVTDFPYEYSYNDQGQCTVLQYRERVLKNRPDLYWKGYVHETVLAKGPVKRVRADNIVWQHDKTDAESVASRDRNHRLLLKDWSANHDPRTAHYLGLSFFALEQFNTAIDYLQEHVKLSGWPEETYRSYLYIAQAHFMQDDLARSLESLDKAINILPDYPDAFVYKGQFLLDAGEYGAALAFIKDARNREIPTQTLSAINETLYTFDATLTGALALLNMGQVDEAFAWFEAARRVSPRHPQIEQLSPLFEQAKGESMAVERVKWLARYLGAANGNVRKLLEALPPTLLADSRMNALRVEVNPPKKWADNSIVFFSGIAPEPWGPDYLQNGMGGSEEAVIYLSRELAKAGWDVTVFCDRETEYEDEVFYPLTPTGRITTIEGVDYKETLSEATTSVHWKPWTLLNPYDRFNVFVAWRNPQLAAGVKANLILCDVHDVISAESVERAIHVDKFMVKSQYHRSLFPNLPDDRFVIVGNGIVKEQFKGDKTKREHSVGYFSSYNRGLECLLEMWPQIRKEVPDATLDIYYGWNVFDKVASPEMKKWKLQMQARLAKLKKDGVIEHGRVSHRELADAMRQIQVWAYPTEFTEIHCITALKAQEAHCWPVVTEVAALAETVKNGFMVDSQHIYTDEAAQAEFIRGVVRVLTGDGDFSRDIAVPGVDWRDVAEVWGQTCS